MRYRWSRVLRVVLLAALIAFVSGAGSATAGYAAPAVGPITGSTYTPLPADTSVTPTTGEAPAEVLRTMPFMMQPGEVLRVTDQLEVRIPSGHGSEAGNEIACFDQNPANYPGNPIAHASTGTNVGNGVNGSDAYQWNVSMLISPPPGDPYLSYFCQIWTYASDKDPHYVMDVLAPAPHQTTYGTWLQVSSGNQAGASQWPFYTCNAIPPLTCCAPDDANHTCEYIGGSGRPAAADLDDYWLAGDGATTFDAVATFQITDCHRGTSSCLASDSGDGIFGESDARGQSWLEVDQLYPDGSVCQASRAYSEKSTGGQVQLSESFYDSDNQHHLPLYYDLSAPVSQLCQGSRLFTVDLHIGWTAGNPVKLDGGDINVINSAYKKTTIVPPVAGLTQAQAGAALQAAGLTTWPAPDYVASAAPPGTVTGENSPAGTTEPAGSPVQLTISLGQTTVPNVVGDLVTKAKAAIKNAGLIAAVNSAGTNCFHPDIVLAQNPGGGAQVAPGSTVAIGITTCTR